MKKLLFAIVVLVIAFFVTILGLKAFHIIGDRTDFRIITEEISPEDVVYLYIDFNYCLSPDEEKIAYGENNGLSESEMEWIYKNYPVYQDSNNIEKALLITQSQKNQGLYDGKEIDFTLIFHMNTGQVYIQDCFKDNDAEAYLNRISSSKEVALAEADHLKRNLGKSIVGSATIYFEDQMYEQIPQEYAEALYTLYFARLQEEEWQEYEDYTMCYIDFYDIYGNSRARISIDDNFTECITLMRKIVTQKEDK